MKRVAIVRLSSLGDIIHSAIGLPFIHKAYPGILIDWIVDEDFKDLLADNPYLNRVISLAHRKARRQKDYKPLINQLKALYQLNAYNRVCDVQGLLKSALVARLCGKPISGFSYSSAREPLAALFYQKRIKIPYEANTILRNVRLFEKAFDLSISVEDVLHKPCLLGYRADTVVSQLSSQKKNILFVIGSTWPSRNYPKEHFRHIAKEIEEHIVILQGSDSQQIDAEFIARGLNHVEVLPRLDINSLKAYIDQVDLVIGNDTGPTHLAWAMNTPSITLFGPTPASRILQTPWQVCFESSSKVNPKKLNKQDFSIKEIDPIKVATKAKELLYSIQPPPKT